MVDNLYDPGEWNRDPVRAIGGLVANLVECLFQHGYSDQLVEQNLVVQKGGTRADRGPIAGKKCLSDTPQPLLVPWSKRAARLGMDCGLLVLGGDGQFYNQEAIQVELKMTAVSDFTTVLVRSNLVHVGHLLHHPKIRLLALEIDSA